MALTSEVLFNSGVTLPDGYTAPTAAISLSDPQSEYETITLAASGIENANPVTGIGALVTALKSALDGTTIPGYGIDVSGNTVDAQYFVSNVTRDHGTSIYSNTDNYIVKVKVDWEAS